MSLNLLMKLIFILRLAYHNLITTSYIMYANFFKLFFKKIQMQKSDSWIPILIFYKFKLTILTKLSKFRLFYLININFIIITQSIYMILVQVSSFVALQIHKSTEYFIFLNPSNICQPCYFLSPLISLYLIQFFNKIINKLREYYLSNYLQIYQNQLFKILKSDSQLVNTEKSLQKNNNQYQMSKQIQSKISLENGLQGVQIQAYKCIESIGRGAFGQVYKGLNTNDNSVIAMKVINKALIQKQKSLHVKKIKKKLMKSEGQIMKKCNSDHVIKCYDIFENEEMIIFILQYCNSGDLKQELQRRKFIPEQQAIKIVKHLINGFAELHKHKVIHRDLKPDNIFKHNEKYKIGDLGFAKIIPDLLEMQQGTTLGTMTTMAPQVMKQGAYGIKADLWSLGIIYYEMIYGQLPIKFKSREQMMRDFKNQINYPQNPNVSQLSINFLKKVLISDPNKRINWQDVYQLDIFKQQRNSVIYDDFQEDVDLLASQQIHNRISLEQNKDKKVLDEINEIEQEEEVIIQKLNFKKIKNQNLDDDKKNLKQKSIIQHEILSYIDQLNFQKHKSQLILEQVFEVLNPSHQFNNYKRTREFCQFMHLIICRCFFIISPISNALKIKKNDFKWKYYAQFLESSIYISFLKDFNQHYSIIKSKKDKIGDQLQDWETKFQNVVKDKCSKVFSKKFYNQKERMINGIFQLDFESSEHVQFTLEVYAKKIIKQLEELKGLTQLQIKNLKLVKDFLFDQYEKVCAANVKTDKVYLNKVFGKYSLS